MRCRRTHSIFISFVFAAVSAVLSACAGDEPPAQQTPSLQAEQTASTTETAAVTSTTGNPEKAVAVAAPDLSPPRPAEVRDAVARVYQNAVMLDARRVDQAIVGDFNGDGSPDIAVVVQPSDQMIAELNSEVANWIVEDPRQVVTPDTTTSVHHLPPAEVRTKIEPGDVLLAIIHGYEETGWRNPNAKQTYLLKNAVGSRMQPQPRTDWLKAAKGKRVPEQKGDVIKETLDGETGILYWTGAKYGWFH